MIEVKNISCGWLSFYLKDEFSEINFVVSYLTDFMDEIDYLLDFSFDDSDVDSKATLLDGEGTDLYLCSYKYVYDNEFFIMVRRDKTPPVVMAFNYDRFKNEWENIKNDIMESYEKDFLMNNDEDE